MVYPVILLKLTRFKCWLEPYIRKVSIITVSYILIDKLLRLHPKIRKHLRALELVAGCLSACKIFALAICKIFSLAIASQYKFTNHQTAPGTVKRPILYSNEADELSETKYLQNWIPEQIILPSIPNYIVEKNTQYSTIQQAINAVVKSGKTTRQYIYIKPGIYTETVYIPKTNVPITLYGDGEDKVKIALTQGANMTLNEWVNQINPNNVNYKEGDPSWYMYEGCVKNAQNNNNKIGTQCSTVVWTQNENLQITNLSIQNPATGSQAVALSVSGDKSELENFSLLGFQDTLYLGGNKTRILINKAYITGYTDFVFGSASVIFKASVFKIVLGHSNSGVIFAPNTSPDQSYGFLVRNSLITGEKGIINAHLGRGWDTNLVDGKYVPGVSANGQILIEKTQIDNIFEVTTPWRTSTSQREFNGNISSSRKLNDNSYNRMWEYNNTGNGS